MYMNKYIKYTLGLVAAGALFISVSAFTDSKTSTEDTGTYVVIDVYEIPAYEDKGLHIHYGNAKTIFVPFPNDMKDHHMDDNGEILVKALNMLDSEGYEVISTTGGLGDKSGMITKIFLRKKK